MKNLYITILTVEGAALGVIFYVIARGAVREFIDVSAVVPQFLHVGLIINLIGVGIALVLLVFVTVSVVKRLGLDKM